MPSIFKKVSHGLRTQGARYLITAPLNELAYPRLPITQHIRNGLVRVWDLFGRRTPKADDWSQNSLQFVYDLGVSPISYDFTSYLAAAEVERRLRGFEAIDVLFVLGPLDGVKRELAEYEAAVDRDARIWRVRHMLIPMLALMPRVRSYAVCADRTQLGVVLASDPKRLYPSDYRPRLPRMPAKRVIHEHARRGVPIFPMMSATARGRRFVNEFLAREAKGRRPIVITLRYYDFSPERNSRVADWVKFADSLDRARYVTIFIHDSETVMRSPPADFSRHVVCEAASWNIEIRMALYEAAWLNMALMHGPLELCWYNERVRYLFFITVGSAAITTAEALEENGHRVGVDLDFATPLQRIIWRADEFETLIGEFKKMESLLEDGAKKVSGATSGPNA